MHCELCPAIPTYSIRDKYDVHMMYACVLHLDDLLNNFLQQTIRVKTLSNPNFKL